MLEALLIIYLSLYFILYIWGLINEVSTFKNLDLTTYAKSLCNKLYARKEPELDLSNTNRLNEPL